jgi:hypothetical protein
MQDIPQSFSGRYRLGVCIHTSFRPIWDNAILSQPSSLHPSPSARPVSQTNARLDLTHSPPFLILLPLFLDSLDPIGLVDLITWFVRTLFISFILHNLGWLTEISETCGIHTRVLFDTKFEVYHQSLPIIKEEKDLHPYMIVVAIKIPVPLPRAPIISATTESKPRVAPPKAAAVGMTLLSSL